MEEEKVTENGSFNKSSMSVVELNNYVSVTIFHVLDLEYLVVDTLLI